MPTFECRVWFRGGGPADLDGLAASLAKGVGAPRFAVGADGVSFALDAPGHKRAAEAVARTADALLLNEADLNDEPGVWYFARANLRVAARQISSEEPWSVYCVKHREGRYLGLRRLCGPARLEPHDGEGAGVVLAGGRVVHHFPPTTWDIGSTDPR